MVGREIFFRACIAPLGLVFVYRGLGVKIVGWSRLIPVFVGLEPVWGPDCKPSIHGI